MKRHALTLSALTLLGLAGTALAQTIPTLVVDAPATTAEIAAEPSLTLTIAAPTEVLFDAISTDGDAQLRLLHDGSFVAEDGDSGDGTNARLSSFLAPGTYQVVAYDYQYRAVTVNLTAVTAPPIASAATIAPNAPPTAIATPAGDWARAASTEVALHIATAGSYTLTADTSDATCSPEITVILANQVQGWVISAASTGHAASDARALTAGDYTLRIRNWNGHACAMTVTATPAS